MKLLSLSQSPNSRSLALHPKHSKALETCLDGALVDRGIQKKSPPLDDLHPNIQEGRDPEDLPESALRGLLPENPQTLKP